MAPPEGTTENGTPDPAAAPEQETNPAVNNGASRFSDDDVDTEIEVTQDENSGTPTRRKKKKTKDEEPRETSEERRERRKRRKEKKRAKEAEAECGDIDPPPYPSSENGDEKKGNKKRNIKKQVNQLLDAPFLFAAGVLVCVILPFGIYACDVILSVNVIDRESYRNAVISPYNNMTGLPLPKKLAGEKYHMKDTLLLTIQINANPKSGLSRSRITRQAPDDEPAIVETASDPTPASTVSTSTEAPNSGPSDIASETSSSTTSSSTTTTTTTASTTSSSTSSVSTTTTSTSTASPTPSATPTNGTASEEIVTMPSNTTLKTTTRKFRNTTRNRIRFRPGRLTTLRTTTRKQEDSNATIDPEPWQRQEGEFCKGLHYFYHLHLTYAKEYDSDWFNDQSGSVYQKEQTLFFMFTIIGFISLLIGLGLRCDVFLSDEWSSFILVNLFLYSISMAVTVAVFAQESGEAGLRCATCRFTSYCQDIDPWDYRDHWPAENSGVQWSMVALLSFILKLIDCYAIAIVTLKFIVDVAADLWWVTCLKVFGWLLVFPVMIFTPMLGVVRYQALPAVAPNDAISRLTVEVFFYIGCVFWGVGLIAMPFFCKTRMCSGSEAEERQEIEDEMYE